jgi:hypothetical protein
MVMLFRQHRQHAKQNGWKQHCKPASSHYPLQYSCLTKCTKLALEPAQRTD